MRQWPRPICPCGLFADLIGTARAAQEGLAMSKMSGRRSLAAILSLLTIGAALSFGVATADRRRCQCHRGSDRPGACARPRQPLTRGLSVGPQTQTDPAAAAAEGRFVQTIRGRATRSLSVTEREEIATIAKDKPKIDLEITFDYNSADISAKSLPSVQALGKALDQSRPEGLDLHRRRPYRRRRRRSLQSGPVGAARRTRSRNIWSTNTALPAPTS